MNSSTMRTLETRLRDTFPHLSVTVRAGKVDYIVRMQVQLRNGTRREVALQTNPEVPPPTIDEMAIFFAHEVRRLGVDY